MMQREPHNGKYKAGTRTDNVAGLMLVVCIATMITAAAGTGTTATRTPNPHIPSSRQSIYTDLPCQSVCREEKNNGYRYPACTVHHNLPHAPADLDQADHDAADDVASESAALSHCQTGAARPPYLPAQYESWSCLTLIVNKLASASEHHQTADIAGEEWVTSLSKLENTLLQRCTGMESNSQRPDGTKLNSKKPASATSTPLPPLVSSSPPPLCDVSSLWAVSRLVHARATHARDKSLLLRSIQFSRTLMDTTLNLEFAKILWDSEKIGSDSSSDQLQQQSSRTQSGTGSPSIGVCQTVTTGIFHAIYLAQYRALEVAIQLLPILLQHKDLNPQLQWMMLQLAHIRVYGQKPLVAAAPSSSSSSSASSASESQAFVVVSSSLQMKALSYLAKFQLLHLGDQVGASHLLTQHLLTEYIMSKEYCQSNLRLEICIDLHRLHRDFNRPTEEDGRSGGPTDWWQTGSTPEVSVEQLLKNQKEKERELSNGHASAPSRQAASSTSAGPSQLDSLPHADLACLSTAAEAAAFLSPDDIILSRSLWSHRYWLLESISMMGLIFKLQGKYCEARPLLRYAIQMHMQLHQQQQQQQLGVDYPLDGEFILHAGEAMQRCDDDIRPLQWDDMKSINEPTPAAQLNSHSDFLSPPLSLSSASISSAASIFSLGASRGLYLSADQRSLYVDPELVGRPIWYWRGEDRVGTCHSRAKLRRSMRTGPRTDWNEWNNVHSDTASALSQRRLVGTMLHDSLDCGTCSISRHGSALFLCSNVLCCPACCCAFCSYDSAGYYSTADPTSAVNINFTSTAVDVESGSPAAAVGRSLPPASNNSPSSSAPVFASSTIDHFSSDYPHYMHTVQLIQDHAHIIREEMMTFLTETSKQRQHTEKKNKTKKKQSQQQNQQQPVHSDLYLQLESQDEELVDHSFQSITNTGAISSLSKRNNSSSTAQSASATKPASVSSSTHASPATDTIVWRQLKLWDRMVQSQSLCQHYFPRTCALFSSPALRVATTLPFGSIKFSLLRGGAHVWPHTGPTNRRIRLHLGIVDNMDPEFNIMEEGKQEEKTEEEGERKQQQQHGEVSPTHSLLSYCPEYIPVPSLSYTRPQTTTLSHSPIIPIPYHGSALRVVSDLYRWRSGFVGVFDDSYEHEVFHFGTEQHTRIILIVDMWHPQLFDWESNKPKDKRGGRH